MHTILLALGLALAVGTVYSLTASEAQANPLKAYVLTDQTGNVVGNSGVRIGPLDLGMTSEKLLRNYGLPNSLIDRFKPYVGLQGQQAQQALQSNPLTITQSELSLIEQKFKGYWLPKFQNAPSTIKNNPLVNELN